MDVIFRKNIDLRSVLVLAKIVTEIVKNKSEKTCTHNPHHKKKWK